MMPAPIYVILSGTQVQETARLARALGHPALARHLKRAQAGAPVGMTRAHALTITGLAATAATYAADADASGRSATFWKGVHAAALHGLEGAP